MAQNPILGRMIVVRYKINYEMFANLNEFIQFRNACVASGSCSQVPVDSGWGRGRHSQQTSRGGGGKGVGVRATVATGAILSRQH